MNKKIDIDTKELECVLDVLKKHLSPKTKLYFFGSRVNGTLTSKSDLDILIREEKALSFELLAQLRDEFEESMLPYKVDLLDYYSVSKEIRKNIINKSVEISFFS